MSLWRLCDEQKLISMSEEIFKEENFFTQHDVENKQLKEENEKLRKEESEKLINEYRNENEQLRKNNVAKDAWIKESIEKPNEIKSSEKDKIRQILILIGLTKISLKTF